MRELLLLRHAKSAWGDPGLADFDRPLANRGKKAAPMVGRLLDERGWLPDFAIVSPAKRTRQTWKCVAGELAAIPPVRFAEDLYEATAETILSAVKETPPEVGRLLVVGHNPGLEDMAAMLAGETSDAQALARMREKFPTSALARITVEGGWPELAAGSGLLTAFVVPREIAG
ncbi:histidine phosphatase [Aquibium oceanicum]|uniref:Histidine phosphatase n=1 Tax=Aquibium oceanicum TaxID=1670800 RepID=A0A1L3SZ47_9HYPH|nr:histidine phosphatase family protein [Aquibium oceanicum]APH74686.1 histidine phosphatase [Aquibium oceanicum]